MTTLFKGKPKGKDQINKNKKSKRYKSCKDAQTANAANHHTRLRQHLMETHSCMNSQARQDEQKLREQCTHITQSTNSVQRVLFWKTEAGEGAVWTRRAAGTTNPRPQWPQTGWGSKHSSSPAPSFPAVEMLLGTALCPAVFFSPPDWTASRGLILAYPPAKGSAPALQIRTDDPGAGISEHVHTLCFLP